MWVFFPFGGSHVSSPSFHPFLVCPFCFCSFFEKLVRLFRVLLFLIFRFFSVSLFLLMVQVFQRMPGFSPFFNVSTCVLNFLVCSVFHCIFGCFSVCWCFSVCCCPRVSQCFHCFCVSNVLNILSIFRFAIFHTVSVVSVFCFFHRFCGFSCLHVFPFCFVFDVLRFALLRFSIFSLRAFRVNIGKRAKNHKKGKHENEKEETSDNIQKKRKKRKEQGASPSAFTAVKVI